MATKQTTRATKSTRPPQAISTRQKAATSQEMPSNSAQESSSATTTSARKIRIKKPYIFAALALIGLALLVIYFKSLFVVATINNQPLSRISFVRSLEQQYGKSNLDQMITNTVIAQEAKKRSVSISDKEIDKKLKGIEESVKQQGQTLETALRGLSKEGFRNYILKYQLLAEKMVEKDITVTDKDLTTYIEQNKQFFPEGSITEEMKKGLKDQLKQQKAQEKVQTLVQELRKKAKINPFLIYPTSAATK